MRITNTTDIDTDLIRGIISFVRPSGISKFDVMIKNTAGGMCGKAYIQGSGYHATADPFIVCRMPKLPSQHARYPQTLRTYQIAHLKDKRYWLSNQVEALVYIIAHELRHLWQAKCKNKRGYNWGSRGRFSEIDTEGYAIKMLRAWRKTNLFNSLKH